MAHIKNRISRIIGLILPFAFITVFFNQTALATLMYTVSATANGGCGVIASCVVNDGDTITNGPTSLSAFAKASGITTDFGLPGISASGEGRASVNLATGALRVFSETFLSRPIPSGAFITGGIGSGRAFFEEFLVFSGVEDVIGIDFSWHLRGEFKGVSGTTLAEQSLHHDFQFGGIRFIDTMSPTVDGFIIDRLFTGTFNISPSSFIVPVRGELFTRTFDRNRTVDFFNTAFLSIDVPEEISFTSASGVFLTQEPSSQVPLPATFYLLSIGLVGLGVVRRAGKL